MTPIVNCLGPIMLINCACVFIFVDTIKFYLRTIQILIRNKIQRIFGLIKTTDINSRRIKIKLSLISKAINYMRRRACSPPKRFRTIFL